MNKRQASQWEHYLSSYSKHGPRDLDKAYGTYSSKKYNAWKEIQKRCAEENGIGLTVSSAGSHYFSTDYIRPLRPGVYEWVHDSASMTQRIECVGNMISEAKEAGIHEP